ncbi:MAG: hypothetical protein PHQ74_05235 [Crocinitomicaceae bacterium]|nr:hypothetical protein [Crocinitomicaceae bacterium]
MASSIHIRFIIIATLVSSLVSCGLKYTPQVSPESKRDERKLVIESEIQREFAAQNKQYKSIGFGEMVTVKPASYISLDSLFELKYNLERQGKRTKEIDENIAMQRLICQNDTNEVLYMEQHVFSLEGDSTAEVLSGNFSLNAKNELRKVKFTSSYVIPKDLVTFYNYYITESAFLTNNNYPTQQEKAFYDSYKNELTNRSGAQEDAFLIHTLRLMKIARKNQSLDKQKTLEALTKLAVHKGNIDYKSEVFVKVEQHSKESGEISFYSVEYQFAKPIGTDSYVTEKYILQFDAFFSQIGFEKVNL